jgi:hypothetical protein
MWCAENSTDGRISSRYLPRLHPDGRQPDAFVELLEAGIWAESDNGFRFIDWDGELNQSTALEVETYKRNARRRARAYRERQRVKLDRAEARVSEAGLEETRDVTRDVRARVGEGEGEGEGSTTPPLEKIAEITPIVSRPIPGSPAKATSAGNWPTRVPGHPGTYSEQAQGQ